MTHLKKKRTRKKTQESNYVLNKTNSKPHLEKKIESYSKNEMKNPSVFRQENKTCQHTNKSNKNKSPSGAQMSTWSLISSSYHKCWKWEPLTEESHSQLRCLSLVKELEKYPHNQRLWQCGTLKPSLNGKCAVLCVK